MNTPGGDTRNEIAVADGLLALSEPDQQLTWLRQANFLHPDGLLSLLDYAAELIRSDPGQARRLATCCAAVADLAAIAEVKPRAAYIKAQTYALAGEFGQALALIHEAREGYLALGQTWPALRTTAGLMHVLGESGRYQAALEAGQSVLAEIGGADEPPLVELATRIQQNMGMCYHQLGRYEEALAAYDTAEARYTGLGLAFQAGDISNNRGVLLWEMGRGTEALVALEKALAIRVEAGLTMLQAQSLSNIGSVHLLLGNYMLSLDHFENARRLFAALDALVDQHVLRLDTANAYLTLNLYPEALAAYQEANQMLQAAGAVHQRVRALWGLGATRLAQGQAEAAEEALAEAVTLLAATSATPTPLLATILLEQAAVQSAQNKPALALTTAQHALELVSGHDWPVPAIYAHLYLADLTRDDLPQTEVHLLAAQQRADPFGLPQLRYRLQQRLGRLRRRQGRNEEARVLLEAALSEVERLRGTLAQETIRTAFLHDKLAVYEELMQLYLAWGDDQGIPHAFMVAEQAKSRTLLDLINGVLDTRPAAAADAAMGAQLQELQADLNAIYNELLNNGGMAGFDARYKTIHARAAELEGTINQLRLQLAASRTGPDLWAAPLSLQAVQAQLSADVTVLAYHIIEDEILAFAVGQNSARLVRRLGPASTVQQQLKRLSGIMDRMRAGQAFNRNQIAWLEQSVRRVLAEIYQSLVAPLEPFLAETGSKLTIIPHGCLHQVPFQALCGEQGYLIDRFEITYAPSAAIYLLCQQRTPAPIQKGLVMGVSDPLIPAVSSEVQAAAAQLPTATVYLDEQATLAALQSAAGCQLLHLACHGLFRVDNPMFSALKLFDGWLTATEAMQLQLADALVILSACESGRSQVAGGDEVLGLLRAFLGAGAATVVVSLWLVQDDTTAGLMSDLYRRLRDQGMSPAAALRAAQLALKTEYPHPYYWAPFIAVGRR